MSSEQRIRQQQAARPTLALYYFPSCPFCVVVLDAFERMGLDIELRNIFAEPQWRQELIQGGGRKTVPCLRIETDASHVTWMYESRDIIRSLHEQYQS